MAVAFRPVAIAVRAELERARELVSGSRPRASELLAFQLGELELATPQPDEDRELGSDTRQILANAERLQSALLGGLRRAVRGRRGRAGAVSKRSLATPERV